MKYEIVFKVIGGVHVILAFLKLFLLLELLRRWLLVLVLGLLRWINVYSRSQRQNKSSTYTYMKIKTNTKKQYNNT